MAVGNEVFRGLLGGISPTFFVLWIKITLIHFGGYITDFWGVYHRLLGGISPTFGGYITDFWGVYHRLFKKKTV